MAAFPSAQRVVYYAKDGRHFHLLERFSVALLQESCTVLGDCFPQFTHHTANRLILQMK